MPVEKYIYSGDLILGLTEWYQWCISSARVGYHDTADPEGRLLCGDTHHCAILMQSGDWFVD